MGLGELGADAARALKALRFEVAGWSNRRKQIDGVESFAGQDGASASSWTRTEILVNLLPLTEQTEGILNRHTLGELPKGACLVNAARGRHLVEEDLLELLGTGQIAEATLDVFREEPLPAGHPFWDHPRITVTPHEAAITPPETAAATIAENIRRRWNAARRPARWWIFRRGIEGAGVCGRCFLLNPPLPMGGGVRGGGCRAASR